MAVRKKGRSKKTPSKTSNTKAAKKRAPRASTRKTGKKAKKVYSLSPRLRNKLPQRERKTASDTLIKKSDNKCAICQRPLGADPSLITADHRLAESKGGKTTIANLYLAHKSCNSSRGNLNFNRIRPLIEFKVFCEETGRVTFDDVIDMYIEGGNRQVSFKMTSKTVRIRFKGRYEEHRMYVDPATRTKYFFAEVPVTAIMNDVKVQPRLIMYNHVRKLALDFYERPVHEPSNCRLVPVSKATAELRQFDGQHKTTAQILIGRHHVPVKIYVDPDLPMLQALVVRIQQEIKKVPLTRSDTLAKLGDVITEYLDSYTVKKGDIRTEKGFISNQPKETRAEVKKLLLSEYARIVFFDEQNRIRDSVRPGSPHPPTSDKVVIDRIIAPLIYRKPLEIDIDAEGGRDNERRLILLILNTIVEKMLPQDWYKDANSLQRTRTQNFFYQGSIRWWMGDILIPTLRYILRQLKTDQPLLIENVDTSTEDQMIEAVEILCDWEIWSTNEQDVIKAMRSNTVANVREAIPDYDDRKLLDEVLR